MGTHQSQCVVGSRQRATFARAGTDSLTFALSLDLYANASCTGPAIGTVSFSAPATLTYTDTRTATLYWLPSGGLSSTQTITAALDHFMVSAPATRTVVTGSGVTVGTVNGHREACVSFDYTNPLCKNIDEVIPAYTLQQGLALVGNTLYVGNTPDASQPDPYNTWYRVNVLYTKQ